MKDATLSQTGNERRNQLIHQALSAKIFTADQTAQGLSTDPPCSHKFSLCIAQGKNLLQTSIAPDA